MNDAIVVLNTGSSSLKFSVFERAEPELRLVVRGQIDGLNATPRLIAKDPEGEVVTERLWRQPIDYRDALKSVLTFLRNHFTQYRVCAVGHRVVHGGLGTRSRCVSDAAVLARLESYIPLAPLHQPHNACADSACCSIDRPRFCRSRASTRLSIETRRGWRRLCLTRRAHGTRDTALRLSTDSLTRYLMTVMPKLDARAAAGRLVLLHLGNGSSMCAVRGGHSMATTMGFTTADGLPMGTRCGSLDPGVILYCMDELKMNVRDVERLIYHESGLLGVSGISSDMRALEEGGTPGARAAIDLYCYRIGRELGSLAAALGGLDAMVFTAGIGEKSASGSRARVPGRALARRSARRCR